MLRLRHARGTSIFSVNQQVTPLEGLPQSFPIGDDLCQPLAGP